MKLIFEGVDISTEEKFVSYIESLNKMIIKQNAVSESKKELYDIPYLRKRYRNIVSKNEKAQFMAEHKCFECVYFQKLARKCRANLRCLLEEITAVDGFT